MSYFPHLILLSCSIVLANACLLNSTHCTCGESPPGGSCLRYSTTVGSQYMCDSYQCGPGTVCDCMGESLCALTSCPSTRNIFRPLPGIKIDPRKLTPCTLATDATCMTIIGDAPKPSPSPSPSGSASPTPSSSVLVSSTPSLSPTPAASPSTSSSPSSSISPVPILPLPRGSFCSEETAPCEDGTTCSCNGKCEKEVDLEIAVLGDDSARIFACREEIGFSRGWEHLGHFSYTGPCSDMIVEVGNENGHYSGLAMAVEYGGNIYTTGYGRGLSVVVEENPPPGYLTYPDYDFSHWKTAIIHSGLEKAPSGAYLMFNEEYGAMPVSLRDGPSPASMFVYKVSMPFCKDSVDWQL